jgi:hypothetical protein
MPLDGDPLDPDTATFMQLAKAMKELKKNEADTKTAVETISTELAELSSKLDTLMAAISAGSIPTTPTIPSGSTIPTGTTTSTTIPSGSGGRGPSISYLNDSSPKPQYNPDSMSPEYYLKELEEYFALRNLPKANWLLLIGRIFPVDSELSSWWIATKTLIKTWDEFRASFIDYQTADLNTDLLNKQLYSRTQKFHESFETYCWEIRALFHKLNPAVSDEIVVDRIINSCLPEIAAGAASVKCKSVVDLVKAGRNIILNINKMRAFERKPLLRIRQSDPVSTRKPSQSQPSHSNSRSSTATTTTTDDSTPSSSNTNQAHTSSQQQTQPKSTCAYCKKPGHSIDECRGKKRADERKNQPQQQQSKNQ